MGSKKHKKNKSERRERYEDYNLAQPSLKLILKVGSNSTPEYGHDSPAQMDTASTSYYTDYVPEKHKKSKKKKKKKDREKKHKHHHKEKRRHRDESSQEGTTVELEPVEVDPIMKENMLRFADFKNVNCLAAKPITRPLIPLISPKSVSSQEMDSSSMQSPMSVSTVKSEKGDSSGREPRTCVLKMKQSKSPLGKILDHILRSLEKRDPHQFFAWPVTDDIAPGYSTIIDKPMDFSTIRQKIDDNEYSTLQEFIGDFQLMCDNAIRYNHVETVYHKAAKKLLHVGAKMLQPESLLRSLRSMMGHLRELSSRELGFELPSEGQENENPAAGHPDSADEGVSTEEPGNRGESEERKADKRKSSDDGEDILAEVQKAARLAKEKREKGRNLAKMGFLRQNPDGTTSMKILVDANNEFGPEKLISLGAFTGELTLGTGQLNGLREDRRNTAKLVKTLNYGAFCSFAPVFDSRFANLTKEETELVLSTYGDETGFQYADSVVKFTQHSNYASQLANGLLDVLTNGEHRKVMSQVMEAQRQRCEEKEIEKSLPDVEKEKQSLANVQVDYEKLRSLADLGIEMDFLDDLERGSKYEAVQKRLEAQLSSNSALIEKLHHVQYERLSQPLPDYLMHVQKAGGEEQDLAAKITGNLTDMAKSLTPEAIAPAPVIRKAMGVANVGLDKYTPKLNVFGLPGLKLNGGAQPLVTDADTTALDMDIDTDQVVQHAEDNVDLDSELREFLEGGSTASDHDTNSIEMLMD